MKRAKVPLQRKPFVRRIEIGRVPDQHFDRRPVPVEPRSVEAADRRSRPQKVTPMEMVVAEMRNAEIPVRISADCRKLIIVLQRLRCIDVEPLVHQLFEDFQYFLAHNDRDTRGGGLEIRIDVRTREPTPSWSPVI